MPRSASRVFLVSVILAATFAACAPTPLTATPPQFTEEAQTRVTPSLTSAPVNTVSADAVSLNGVTIMVWHPWFGVEASLLETQVAKFNSSNEWGISVLTSSQSNYTELFNNVTGALAAPEKPNLVIGLPEHALYWDERNGVVDLTPYVTDPKWGLSEADIADFPSVFWKQDQVGVKRLGLPAERTTRLIFYNETWARELGFTAPPTTPEDFQKQACAANKALRANNDSKDDALGGWYVDADPMTPLSWMLAFGGGAQEGESYRFLTPGNIEAFRFVKTLFEAGCAWQSASAIPTDEFAARHALFISGSLEDFSAQSRALNTLASADQWTVLPFPGKASETVVVYGSSFIMLPSTEAEQLATWLFVRWMLSPENQADWVQTTGLFPLRNSTMTRVADYAATHPQWVDAVKLLPYGQGTPQLASWRQIRVALGDGFDFMFRINLPVGQVATILAQLDTAVKDLTK